jgi:hypothetical protein
MDASGILILVREGNGSPKKMSTIGKRSAGKIRWRSLIVRECELREIGREGVAQAALPTLARLLVQNRHQYRLFFT